MVRITVEMSAEEMAAIKQLTRLDDDAAAIMKAASEFLRFTRLRELKSASGKADFQLDWEKLEELEIAETSLPQYSAIPPIWDKRGQL